VESINVTFDETCGRNIKEEGKESLKHVHEEDVKEEEVALEEDEEEK
jgi:hypothetical protein